MENRPNIYALLLALSFTLPIFLNAQAASEDPRELPAASETLEDRSFIEFLGGSFASLVNSTYCSIAKIFNNTACAEAESKTETEPEPQAEGPLVVSKSTEASETKKATDPLLNIPEESNEENIESADTQNQELGIAPLNSPSYLPEADLESLGIRVTNLESSIDGLINEAEEAVPVEDFTPLDIFYRQVDYIFDSVGERLEAIAESFSTVILNVRGTSSPGISVSGQGRIYFDSTSNTFKVSENGGAYVDLVEGGFWLDSGSDIYYNNGNVGIGTATPSTALDVNGVITATGGDSDDWNAAFSWGNHATVGYLISTNNLSDIADAATARTNLGLGALATMSDLSSFTTDDLTEGTTNLYYTDARARSSISETITGITYTSSTGAFSLDTGYAVPDTTSIGNWNTAFGWNDHSIQNYFDKDVDDTDDITEGSTNLFSQWIPATGGINYAGGNVGVGTTNPGARLEVYDGRLRVKEPAGNYVELSETAGYAQILDHYGGQISFYPSGGRYLVSMYNSNYPVKLSVFGNSGGLNTTSISHNNSYGEISTGVGDLILSPAGNVGIGTTSPSTALDINGALTTRGIAAPAVADAGRGRIYFDSTENKFKVSEDGAAYKDLLGAASVGASGAIQFADGADNLLADENNLFWDDNNNRLGIGTNVPGYALEVVSSVTAAKFSSMLNAWNLAVASYDSVSFSVASQSSLTAGISFSTDGTKMYIVDFNRVVYQYTLSTAWDVGTASYSASYTLPALAGAGGTTPYDLTFSNDGTTMYVVYQRSANPEVVYQYTLSTAWDLTTVTGSSGNFALSDLSDPRGISFSSDGTKMYATNLPTDSVHQYSLATPWDITTLSYDFVSLSVNAQAPTVQGLTFSSDGKGMFVIDESFDSVVKYSLSTAWDLSTSSYSGPSFSFASRETSPVDLSFSSDGTKMYVVGIASDSIYQYTTSEMAGGDVVVDGDLEVGNTLSLSSSFTVEGISTAAVSVAGEGRIYFDSTTNSFKVSENGGDYRLLGIETSGSSGALQFSDGSGNLLSDENNIFWDSGSKRLGIGTDIPAHTLEVISPATAAKFSSFNDAWNIADATYDSVTFNLSQDRLPTGLTFSTDGTKMFVLGDYTDAIYQYTLSTAWDISTATYDSVLFSTTAQSTSPRDIAFSVDGTKLYVAEFANGIIYQYTLSTAWDISTATYDSVLFSTTAQSTWPNGIAFAPDGSKMFFVSSSADSVYEYNLSTPWDISTATYSGNSFSVVSQENNPGSVSFSANGERMFIAGTETNNVYEYSLDTGWDLSTATYGSVFYDPPSPSSVYTAAFSADGAKMYLMEGSYTSIYQYTTGQGVSGGHVLIDGDLGVGDTTPDYKLHVAVSGTGSVAGFTNDNGTCTVDPNTSSLSCASDARLKTVVGNLDAETSLKRLTALQAVSYHWNSDAEDAPMRYGFIAQEVRNVFPELVIEGAPVDPNDPESDRYLSVSYGGFTPFIIDALKNLNMKVEILAAAGGAGMSGSLADIIGSALKALGVEIKEGVLSVKELIADRIWTKELCVGDTCINETELKDILESSGVEPRHVEQSEDVVEGEIGEDLEDQDEIGVEEGEADNSEGVIDTKLPVITLNGSATITLVEGEVYVDTGAAASDNIDGDITENIAIDNPVDINTPGTYTVTYIVSDSAGNESIATREVIVGVSTKSELGESTKNTGEPDETVNQEGPLGSELSAGAEETQDKDKPADPEAEADLEDKPAGLEDPASINSGTGGGEGVDNQDGGNATDNEM